MSSVAIIRRWTPKHEEVVQLHVMGLTNTEIESKTKYKSARVAQIIADPTARRLIESVVARMRERMIEDIDGGLLDLSIDALKRLAETIKYEEFTPGSEAKKHQDNLSLNLLKGVGFLGNGRNSEEDRERESPLNTALSTRLIVALEEANEADSIRREETGPVIEADFTIVEEGSKNGKG